MQHVIGRDDHPGVGGGEGRERKGNQEHHNCSHKGNNTSFLHNEEVTSGLNSFSGFKFRERTLFRQ